MEKKKTAVELLFEEFKALSKAARDVRVQYRDNLEANSARNWSACK